MGCSSSTLSISSSMTLPLPIAANNHPISKVNSDTWDLIEDYEEEYHQVVVDQNVSFHKLLKTYEFIETNPFLNPSAVDHHLNNVSVSPNLKKIKNDTNVVLYITTMRGIRKTYDDCRAINSILDGFRLAIDKRDIAMDLIYKTELHSLLGKDVKPPQLFIGTEHVGGADVVLELYESGELRKLLEGCRVKGLNSGCCVCGDTRFIMCSKCRGSKKVFDEEYKKSSECSRCNENGLVKCIACNT